MLSYLVDWFGAGIVPLFAVLLYFGAIKKDSARKTILICLFTIYFSVMLDITGICDVRFWRSDFSVNYFPFSDLLEKGFSFDIVFQYAANLIMFIPFGCFLPAIWKRFQRFRSTLIAGAAVSLLIEVVQLFLFRLTAVDDLMLNTLGAIAGYGIIARFTKKAWEKSSRQTESNDKKDAFELFAVVCLVFLCAFFVKYPICVLIYGFFTAA